MSRLLHPPPERDLTPWQTVLREGDSAREDPGLTADEAARMRRLVLAAARDDGRRSPLPRWAVPAAALGLASLAGIAGVAAWSLLLSGHWPHSSEPQPPAEITLEAFEFPPLADRRQIHFTTPGGTRVIWFLAPDAPKESAP